MNAGELVGMLEKHYASPPSKPDAGLLIKELQAPHSLRRADALWCPITTQGRGAIIGHEIKVSRADLITELRDPTKADTWAKYCHKWWLVISDEKFLEGLDIPDWWGVLVPPKRANTRFMHVVQKAPPLKPAASLMQEAWGTIYARVAFGTRAQQFTNESNQRQIASLTKQLSEARASIREANLALGQEGVGRRGATKVAEIISAVERLGGYGDDIELPLRGLSWQVEAEDVARGILRAKALEHAEDEIDAGIAVALARAESSIKALKAMKRTAPPVSV